MPRGEYPECHDGAADSRIPDQEARTEDIERRNVSNDASHFQVRQIIYCTESLRFLQTSCKFTDNKYFESKFRLISKFIVF